MGEVDVAVVGGGPAGLATAAGLARRGRRVVLFERTEYEGARVGETLGAEALALLKGLGAGEAMAGIVEAQVPLRAVVSAWGTEDLVERHAMLHPLGEGAHVDRARFDAAMAEWAQAQGVEVVRGVSARVGGAGAGAGARFVVRPSRGPDVAARIFVDASGRGAPASARLAGRRWLALDRQVAIVARLRGEGAGDEMRPLDPGWELLLEAVEDGYWYSAPQPRRGLVVALVTDADLAIAGGPRAGLGERFTSALARARHTSARCAGRALESEPRIVRADGGRLIPACGARWHAVGDAAFATDPLAGNGVARALRSAASAIDRIDAELGASAAPSSSAAASDEGAEPSSITRYDEELTRYVDRRASYYALEGRWPDAPFWARRRPPAWREAAITLDPTTSLRHAGDAPSHAEALLPPRALAAVLERAHTPAPAHVLLDALRAAAPLGDRRLLVALQLLVESGALVPA
jgi:flavin-dependent dehydrogenase